MKALDIKQTLRQFIIENCLKGDTSIKLADDDSLLDNQVIDSTGVLELVLFIEETFNIRVEDEELIPENLDSFTKMEAYIQSKLKK